MKKKYLLILFLFAFLFASGQSDTIYFSKEKLDSSIINANIELSNNFEKKIRSLELQYKSLKKESLDHYQMQNIIINNLDSILHFQTETLNKTLLKLSSLKDSLSSFQLASSVQINKLESEQNKKVSNISKEQLQLSNNINTVKQESSNYFISLNVSVC